MFRKNLMVTALVLLISLSLCFADDLVAFDSEIQAQAYLSNGVEVVLFAGSCPDLRFDISLFLDEVALPSELIQISGASDTTLPSNTGVDDSIWTFDISSIFDISKS